MPEGEAVLRLDGVSIAFGGLRVLDNVSFEVRRGEVAGLIGPNGAGKSTCFNVITSVYRPDTGSISLNGSSIVGLRPDQVCRRGVARTFQLVRTFQRMTALQNVQVGAIYGNRQRSESPDALALEVLALVGLADQRNRDAAHMTLSDRRMLQLQLLTRRNDPAPAETWGQDAARVLGSASDAASARRLQNVLKALLRK